MNVIMPQLGETVAEGKIGVWFKQVGDAVAAGDNLFEIETDKVTMEVQATESGVLSEIRVGAGETVPVGTVVAVIGGAAGASVSPPAPPIPTNGGSDPALARGTGNPPAPTPMAPARAPEPAPSPLAPTGSGQPIVLNPFEEVRTPTGDYGSAKGPQGLRVTPLARRLIKQKGLDIEAIAQSVRARGGARIAAADALAAETPSPTPAPVAGARPAAPVSPAEAPAPRPRQEPGARDTVEPLNRIRLQTARRMAETWRAVPHAFQAVEVDLTRADAARQAAKAAFAERHGVGLTHLALIARAVCLALPDFPRINASFDEDRLILHRAINLGIAVDIGHEGLVVPVIRDADELTVAGIAKAIGRLAEKARANKLTPADVEGGTYSLTNNGSFGTAFTMPIINAPQVAILSTDGVRKRPMVVETEYGEVIAPRLVATLGQSFDHRAFDGGYAATFLKRVKEILETRDWAAELG